MKEYTAREFKRILERNGYQYERCKGDHATYKNAKTKKQLTYNIVRFKPIVAQRLIKEHQLITCR